MKKIFLIAIAFVLTEVAFSQAITEGESQVNAGIGLSGWGLPVYVGYEYGFSDVISGGVEGSYRNFNQNYSGYKYKYSVLGLGAYGNYHFNEVLSVPDPWDVYAGLTFSYYNVNVDNDYSGAYDSGTSFGGQIGARYFFSDNMAVNLEFNGGSLVTGGKLGVTIKL